MMWMNYWRWGLAFLAHKARRFNNKKNFQSRAHRQSKRLCMKRASAFFPPTALTAQ